MPVFALALASCESLEARSTQSRDATHPLVGYFLRSKMYLPKASKSNPFRINNFALGLHELQLGLVKCLAMISSSNSLVSKV